MGFWGLRLRLSQNAGKTRNCSEARAMMALVVRHEDHLSLTELGTRLGRDLSGLSQAVNRLRKRAQTNPRLAGKIERLKQQLGQIPICQAPSRTLEIHTYEELRRRVPRLPVPGTIQLVCSGRGSPIGGSALCGTESGSGRYGKRTMGLSPVECEILHGDYRARPARHRSKPCRHVSRIGSDCCSPLTKVGLSSLRKRTRTGRPAGDTAFVARVEDDHRSRPEQRKTAEDLVSVHLRKKQGVCPQISMPLTTR